MGLHSITSNGCIPPLYDFTHTSSGSSTACFIQTIKWKPMLANQSRSISTYRIRYSRRGLACEVSSKIVEGSSLDFGSPDLKPSRKNLAVFVSGGGSNFKAIHEATVDGLILGNVAVLVTNKPGCGGAIYAKENNIPVVLFPQTKEVDDGLSLEDLLSTLRSFKVDYVLLAGYLKLIPVELVRDYPKRIVNIHPSLLPAFGGKGYYGLKVHKAVIASGARYSGPTIHFVDEEYDTGRILAQRAVPVCAFDTPEELAARVLQEEHRLYVDVVAALCEDRIIWREDGVPLIRSKEDPKHYI